MVGKKLFTNQLSMKNELSEVLESAVRYQVDFNQYSK